jgi:Zn-dependent protease with chaperone function
VNFFERQRAARGTTVRLVLLFTAAVLAIVVIVDAVVLIFTRSQPASSIVGTLVAVTAVTLLIITGGTVGKTLALRAGGSAVARSVGAVAVDPTTSDPQLRRFVNIVEEMSLASGVPMPRLFVLEREPGINAFAAGYSPADAALTVTGGALQQLNRDELQGVIGHEFSHVLNGDMRLNIRLIGLLNGILLLGLIGLRVLSFGGGRDSDRKGGGAAPILAIALAFTILGFVGQFFAGLIKAAVSRQREWLADASAVQFTRQTTGLEGALKKIAGLPTGSALTDARGAQEVSHMLFGEGRRSFSRLYATHPPLFERIAALDPSFRPDEVAQLQEKWAVAPPNGLAEDYSLGLTATQPPTQQPTPSPTVPPPPAIRTTATDISARVGTLTAADLARGAQLSAQIPARFRQLATQGTTTVPLVLAMLIATDPAVRATQLERIARRLGPSTADTTRVLVGELSQLPPLLRLPVVSIAVPLIANRPRVELDAVTATLNDVVLADGSISLFEYCLTRLIAGYLHDANYPSGRSRPGHADMQRVQVAAVTVLAAMAAAGNADPAAAQRAFDAAIAHLSPGSTVPYSPPADTWRALDDCWAPLDSLEPRHKQTLVEAMVVAVLADGKLTPEEAELLRTACALVHCPLPSLVA